MKRPLLWPAILYAAGILAAAVIPLPLWPLLAAGLVFATIALLWARLRPTLLYPLILLAGLANYTLHSAALSPHDLRRVLKSDPDLVTVRGRLRESPTFSSYQRGEKPTWRTQARIHVSALRPNNGSWQPAHGAMAVTAPGTLTNLFAGQEVEVFGVAGLPRLAAAEGTFDYRSYLKQQGIYYQLQTTGEGDWRILSSPRALPLADRFRVWARQALARGLPVEDESLRLEWALTLGWKAALTEEVSEPFVQAATYHIFAVDGLRMAIVFGIFFGLFRAVGLPRAACGLVLTPLIWFYVALTGWPASAIRATVMLTIIIGGWALRRPSDLINSLLAAAILILTWQPQQLFQAGFQLSFLVVLILILILKPLHALAESLFGPDPWLPPQLQRHWPGWLRRPALYGADLWFTSLAAWIGSLPLVAFYFHVFTPISTPANVLAVPLCGLVLISNLASLLLITWFPAAAELFNHAGWFAMECIRTSSQWFTHWPVAYFYVPAPSLLTSTLYYALLLGLLSGWLVNPARRWWKWSAVAVAALAWILSLYQEAATTRLTILSVSGGTAIYCDALGKKNDLLIDCGPTNSIQWVTKPFLRAQGVNQLPPFVLSHGDIHHVGGATWMVDLLGVNQVCASEMRFRSAPYRQALDRFRRIPGLVRTIHRGDRIGAWTVLHPDPEDRYTRADDAALVLEGTLHGIRVLLLSDLGHAGQQALLERTPDLRADIVVSGLPATGEALSDALLEAIQPRLIIISDSELPASERASQQFRERLARKNIPLLYTRWSGAATIEFSRKGWAVRTINGLAPRPGLWAGAAPAEAAPTSALGIDEEEP
jgi:competence protein ComEC